MRDWQQCLTNLAVKQDKGGSWTADFDYFFTGEPSTAYLYVDHVHSIATQQIPIASDLARRALNQDCEAREVLSLAESVKWAAATPGPERTESLNQARIYLPAGPMPFCLLTQ